MYKINYFILYLSMVGITLFSNPHTKHKYISFKRLESTFHNVHAWGLHTSIDLQQCNSELIRSEESIKKYLQLLCEHLNIIQVHEPHIFHVGDTEQTSGYTFTLHSAGTTILGRIIDQKDSVHLDIIKDALFDPNPIIVFTQSFFQTTKYLMQVHFRI